MVRRLAEDLRLLSANLEAEKDDRTKKTDYISLLTEWMLPTLDPAIRPGPRLASRPCSHCCGLRSEPSVHMDDGNEGKLQVPKYPVPVSETIGFAKEGRGMDGCAEGWPPKSGEVHGQEEESGGCDDAAGESLGATGTGSRDADDDAP